MTTMNQIYKYEQIYSGKCQTGCPACKNQTVNILLSSSVTFSNVINLDSKKVQKNISQKMFSQLLGASVVQICLAIVGQQKIGVTTNKLYFLTKKIVSRLVNLFVSSYFNIIVQFFCVTLKSFSLVKVMSRFLEFLR